MSWDVNVTDLGARQWWEVAIVPASFNSGVADCPQCAVIGWLSPDPAAPSRLPGGFRRRRQRSVRRDIKVSTDGIDRPRVASNYERMCARPGGLRLEGDPPPVLDHRQPQRHDHRQLRGFATYTVPGSFPAGGFNVVFKDHNYTPDKDGTPVGHTWHWDNIIVK